MKAEIEGVAGSGKWASVVKETEAFRGAYSKGVSR
jgi:hypothetical protein